MNSLLNDIEKYWTNRATGYSKVNQNELASQQKDKWQKALTDRFPKKNPQTLHILDIGTGPGFFAIILAELNYNVTAIDYTNEMLVRAKENAKNLTNVISWKQMDAQNLTFPNNSFDIIVTRNLTWNLENPQKAYSEWYRVLKNEGLLLNFDANWYAHLFDDDKKRAYELDRKTVAQKNLPDHYTCTDIISMEKIAQKVPLSAINRPNWDINTLKKIGFKRIKAITDIWQNVWSKEEIINYASTPMFLIQAYK